LKEGQGLKILWI